MKARLIKALKARPDDRETMLLAWPALGDEAREVWTHYRDENHALRLKCYEQVEAQAGAAAVPWLVERLVDHPRWDFQSEYGGVSKSKYLVALLALIGKHPAEAHLATLERALATVSAKAVQRALGDLRGDPPPPDVRHFSGADGYRMDVYADALLAEALRALEEEAVSGPIEALFFTPHAGDGGILLPFLDVTVGGEEESIELLTPDTPIPEHIELACDDDDILPRFAALHELEEEVRQRVRWGDTMRLPHSALIHEHHLVAERLVHELRARGVALAPDVRYGTSEDPILHPRQRLERMCREGLRELLPEQRADMAALLYESPERQRWLLEDPKAEPSGS